MVTPDIISYTAPPAAHSEAFIVIVYASIKLIGAIVILLIHLIRCGRPIRPQHCVCRVSSEANSDVPAIASVN